MNQEDLRDCPLCGAYEVACRLIDHGDKKYFSCPTCKSFIISRQAENRIARDSARSWREELSGKAASLGEGDLLFIKVPAVVGEADLSTSVAVTATVQPKASWRK